MIALGLGLAEASQSSAQRDPERAPDKRIELMSPVPKTKTGLFVTGHVELARHHHDEPPEEDDPKADWPTDDFGQPLRGCDVPWDFVPQPRK